MDEVSKLLKMEFHLKETTEHILILGAGASKDYGLPVWKELGNLMKQKIQSDKESKYKYKNEIIDWIDKVDKTKLYQTIDECIAKESVSDDYRTIGEEVENEIFLLMKELFEASYTENPNGWIKLLNDKILNDPESELEDKILFINYNYDYVLDKNFLNYDYLPSKHKRYNSKPRLNVLKGSKFRVLFPHGNFYPEDINPHIIKYVDTMKSKDGEHVDAVSCYESHTHNINKDHYGKNPNLYFLGVGSGMKINLRRINFPETINEIHVTVKNPANESSVIKFLSERFKVAGTEIKTYESCDDLIERCFGDAEDYI